MAGAADVPVSIAALFDAANAERRSGRISAARALFHEAAEAAAAVGDGPGIVAAVLGSDGIWVCEQRETVARSEARSRWERAAALVAPGSVDAERLAVRRAAEATYEDGPVEAVEAAVERVRELDDDRALAESLSLLHHCQLSPRYAEARLTLAEELLEVATRANDELLTLMGLCWRTVDLFLLGDPRARQSLEELRERAHSQHCEAVIFIVEVLDAMIEARAGHFIEAEAAAGLAAQRGSAVGDPDTPLYAGAMVAALRWWQGRCSEVLDVVREIAVSPRLGHNDHSYVASDAMFSALAGDLDGAEGALARLSSVGLDRLPDSSTWLTTQFLVAETAYRLGDAATAATVLTLIAPYSSLPVMPSLAVVCLGPAERSLGLAFATTGQVDAAIHHLEGALRADARLGNRPLATLTEHDLATVLRARNHEDDVARADELDRRASERAMRLGMQLPDPPAWLRPHAPSGRASREFSLRRVRSDWLLLVGDRTTVLSDHVGFAYIATLVSRPGENCHVLDLVTSGCLRDHLVDEVADRHALVAYRERGAELLRLLDSEDLDSATAVRYRRELDGIAEAIQSAIGLGGRVRGFPDSGERARTAVRKAIVRAIDRIGMTEAGLAAHLRASVVTGICCRYEPASGWSVRPERQR